jgi:hypothetical protein
MDPLLKKMTWKEGLNIQVWNIPEELGCKLELWKKEGLIDNVKKPDFLLGFVKSPEELSMVFNQMRVHLPNDEQLWIAYPKKNSKKYKATINRDSGWAELGAHNFEGVRQIAIDDDWSALRFRKIVHIKTMTRKFSVKDQKK